MTTAYEIGLSTEQFWRMTPLEFDRRCQAYRNRHRPSAIYFRELYALLMNLHRTDEKVPLKTGKDILVLEGEKRPRKGRKAKPVAKNFSQARIDEIQARFNRVPIVKPSEE